MKARATAVQGVLAVVGLTAAYFTWQRPKETTVEKRVTIVSATKQSLEKVHFEDGTRYVELTRTGDQNWVKLGYLPGKTPVIPDAGPTIISIDGGVDGGTIRVQAAPPIVLPTRETHSNDRATEVFAKMSPLEGTRALGVVSDNTLSEIGIAGSERRLQLTVAGTQREFLISKAVQGVIGAYAQDEKTKEVYLLDGTTLSDLDPSSLMLIDRRLHTFKANEFDHFTLSFGGKTVEFVQTNADIQQTAKVARAATPDKPDEIAKNWHDKIWGRMVVTDVLGKGELPKDGLPEVALKISYTSRGKEKGFLEIGFDSMHATWARSENTASWVAIHQGSEEIVLEATRIINP